MKLCFMTITCACAIRKACLRLVRHSFASLCYHLRVPEQIAMEIGGWSDAGTMRRIYTHIAQSDFERYRGELAAYFANENANKDEKA